jgi:hypothetical protein
MPKKKKKTNNKSDKSDLLTQTYIKNNEWVNLYNIENKLLKIIKDIYYGKIINRYEIYEIYTIQIQFKIFAKTFEILISRRENNYGLSIYNIEEPFKHGDLSLNKTIHNDKFYLYNIYKIVFIVLQNCNNNMI